MSEQLAAAVAHGSRLAITYLPPQRRGLRIAELTERTFGRPTEPLTAIHQTGYKVECDLSDSIQRSIFYTGTYEPRLTALIRAELRPWDHFLDLGANIGHFSLLAAKADVAVDAIEASPSTAKALERTCQRNGLREVTVHQVAVSDRSGSMVLAEGPDASSVIGTRHLDPTAESGEQVQVVRCPEVVHSPPTVVKVDVEGADLRALVGMEEWLTDAPPRCLFVEAIDEQLARFGDSVSDLVDFMAGHGYQAEHLSEQYYAAMVIFRKP